MKRKKIFSVIAAFLAFVLAMAPGARALELVVSDNGSGSSNEINTQVEQTTTVQQTNEAEVSNDVTTDANTGGNEASGNTGGDVEVVTGDVSQEVSVETSVNSTAASAGCCPQTSEATISGNGADSVNTVNLNQTNKTNIVTNQTAKVTNNIQGSANTGENTANDNTGGSVSIDTGNINAGGVIVSGPINSARVSSTSGLGSLYAKIAGNGSASVNTISSYLTSNSDVFLNFNSYLDNFVNWDLNTGRNDASGNTGGDVSIATGDINFELLIKNIANIGGVDIDCCPFDPGKPPKDGDDEGGPGEPPSEGEEPPSQDGGAEGDGEDGGGELLPAAAAVEAGGPGIAGLSDTGSDKARTLFFMAGLLMMAVGAHLVGREALDKLPARKNGK